MNSTIVLSIGDSYHLGAGKDRIIYAGMPSDKIYSIVQKRWQFFYQGYAWNLFFPREQSEIRVDGINLLVEKVDPQQIVLRV